MSKSHLITRSLAKVVAILPYVLLVLVGVPTSGIAISESSKLLGLKTIPVPVVGTGSMYPSLFWSTQEGGPEDESKKVIEEYRSTPMLYKKYAGIEILGRTYLQTQIGYGDMVAFKNSKTASILKEEGKDTTAGFIKRVIGVPGDKLELRDGFVYKNGSLLSEPYIFAPKSTYGGSTFKDCYLINVPPGQYFVLGDNRKVSSDSRFELGFVAQDDIAYVLPYAKQKVYQSLWRDPAKDQDLLGQPSLSSTEFVTLLNQVRKVKKLPPLSLKATLNESSRLRGASLLDSKTGSLDLKQSTAKAGYSNIVLGEFVSYGAYSAKELVENLTFNQKSASQVMDKNYTDIGITALNKEVDGCPTQLIVGHLGGYIPATYDSSTLSSWRDLEINLRMALPSWEKAVDNSDINQEQLGQLLTILRRRQALAAEVLSVIEKREWMSDALKAKIDQDLVDATTGEKLIKAINGE